MKKYFLLGSIALLALLALVTVPVYAVSTDFLTKATEYYQKTCTKKIESLQPSTAVICYLVDKVQEHDQALENVESQQEAIDDLDARVTVNTADIVLLKERRVLAYGQYRGAGFTTTATSDVPTDTKVEITCSSTCILFMNYVVDSRNNQTGAHNFYQLYLDGTALSFQNQASYGFPGQAIPISLTGIYPASAGNHTVQVYAHPTAGQLEEHTKTLTVLAIGQ